jgi:uncharacterized protein YndB with AHSA1/START domain
MTSDASTGTPVAGSLRSADGAGIVRLEGRFDAATDEVWSALTDRGRLAQWLGEIDGDLRLGSDLQARFVATGWEGTCHVEVCEPDQRLLVLTKSDGEPDCVIEVTLTADGEHTLVVAEDRGLPIDQIAAYGAGDQVLVEDLVAHLAGRGRCDSQARWRELHPRYQELAAQI